MAYTPSSWVLLNNGLGGQGPATWSHSSADATGVVDAADFFSTGGKYGIKVGDIVQHSDTTTAAAVVVSTHVVNTVNATTGSLNVSAGVSIGTGGTSGD